MFSASRRGHVSIARTISRSLHPYQTAHKFLPSQSYVSSVSRTITKPGLRLFHSSCSRPASGAIATAPAPEAESSESKENGLVTQFEDLAERGMVSRSVVNTLTKYMKLVTMTPVQSQTINETLKGDDVLAQARTGTGKTLAFLVPVLQRLIAQDPSLEGSATPGQRNYGPDIRALIISPTRELAEQIAVEARKVTRKTNAIVQTAVGGSGKRFSLQKVQNEGCHILVGTPGRLHDVLSDPGSGIDVKNLDVLVLDEADRLLDDGFAPELLSIKRLLPDKERDFQTLMFSATVPEEVMEMVRRFMRPGYRFVRTVQLGEQPTHEKVPQKLVHVKGLENMLPSLLELMQRELARTDAELPFKAIVFFNANAEASLAADIFQRIRRSTGQRIPIIEMHSKLSQQQRTRASQEFRRAQSAVMFSSDVSSRGMDFPNVTHVIQLCVPKQTDLYVHRIGRTARGDKKGEAWLFISPIEQGEVATRLRNMPLARDTSLATPTVDMTQDSELPANVAECLTEVIKAARVTAPELRQRAYKACIGTFQWYPNRAKLVEILNRRAKYGWGMETPPAVSSSLMNKLGFRGVPGLNITSDLDRASVRRPTYAIDGVRGRRQLSDRFTDSPSPRRNQQAWQQRGRVAHRQRLS